MRLAWSAITPPLVADATVSPDVVVVLADVSDVANVVFPDVVAAVGDVPAVSVTGDGLVTAVSADAAGDVAAVTLTYTSLPTPTAVAAVGDVPGVSLQTGSETTISVAEVIATTKVDTGTTAELPHASALTFPSSVVATAGITSANAGPIASPTPATVAAVATVASGVAVQLSAAPNPDAVVAVAAVPAPIFIGDRDVNLSPASVDAVTVINDGSFVDVIFDATTAPAVVAAVGDVPAVATGASVRLDAVEVASVAAVGAVSYDGGAGPDVVAAVAGADSVETGSDSGATPATVAAVADAPTPQESGSQDAVVTPNEVGCFARVDFVDLVGAGNAFFFPDTVAAFLAMTAPHVNHSGRSKSATVRAATVRADVGGHRSLSGVS